MTTAPVRTIPLGAALAGQTTSYEAASGPGSALPPASTPLDSVVVHKISEVISARLREELQRLSSVLVDGIKQAGLFRLIKEVGSMH